jgi:hypothetical protein
VTIQLPASDGDGPEALLWVSFLEPQDLTDAVIIAEIEGQGQKVTAKAYAQSVGASAPWADGGKVQLGLIAPTYVSFALDRPKYQDSQFDARQVSAVGLSFRNLVGADSATLTLVSLRIVRLEG